MIVQGKNNNPLWGSRDGRSSEVSGILWLFIQQPNWEALFTKSIIRAIYYELVGKWRFELALLKLGLWNRKSER